MSSSSPQSAPEEGVGFLLSPVGTHRIFTPEDFTEDHRLFVKTAEEFVAGEIVPRNDAIEKLDYALLRKLMRQAGELGLLAVDIPESYGGLGLDKTTSALVSEAMAVQGSWAVTFGAHTGIGTMPIVIFGTEDQKRRYLPKLATGEKVAAYCLSEPGSGSDAMGAKTVAVRDGDDYVLTGVKQWITNAHVADVYIVFAQVDARLFTAFIVEREMPGVSVGKEEHKLGLKGSSTAQLILEDVRVPARNLLGEIGKGSVIAFNILNIGRYKLGVGSGGVAKRGLNDALKYAAERRQFQTPIIEFRAIREKLARAAAFLYANDAMAWRLCGALDTRIAAGPSGGAGDDWAHTMEILKDFTIECSMLKVYGSEGAGRVMDEAIQILGGYGYTHDYPCEQPYRDVRVNRIFEGTNEINRMLVPGTLFKRVMQGKLNLMPAMMAVEGEVKSGVAALAPPASEPIEQARFMTEQAKKVLLYVAGAAAQKYMAELDRQQEILLALADMLTDVWAADSTLTRALQALDRSGDKGAAHAAIARVVVTEAYRNVAARARELACHLAKTPERMVGGIDRLAPYVPVDLVAARREVADAVIGAGRYPY